jgi:hypothetical protein
MGGIHTETHRKNTMYYVMQLNWDGSEEQIAICTTEEMAEVVAQAMRDSDTVLRARRYVVV